MIPSQAGRLPPRDSSQRRIAAAPSRPVWLSQAWSVSRQRISDAMQLVESKATPEEADSYKRFVMMVAQAAVGLDRDALGARFPHGGQRLLGVILRPRVVDDDLGTE